MQNGRDSGVCVTFQQALRGRYQDRLEITFEDLSLRQRFIIVRAINVVVGSKADYEVLKPVAPYVPRKPVRRTPETEILPGDPPPALTAIKWVATLPLALIPRAVSSALSTGHVQNIVAQLQRTVLPPSMNADTYSRHFKALLWIEEHQME